MHRHHALRRQIEIQCREHRLLHLAGIRRPADQHDLAGEIDRHHGVGAVAAAVTFGVRFERRHVDDGHVRYVARKLRARRADQKLANEQRMPGVFGEDPRLDAVFRVGAAVEILREQRLALGMGDEVLQQIVKVLFALLAIAVPPDGVFGRRVDDGVFVLGRAAGVMSGFGAERAAGDDGRLIVADGVLVKRGLGKIPMNAGEIFEAEFVGAVRAIPYTSFLHPSLRHCACLWARFRPGEGAVPLLWTKPAASGRATLYRDTPPLPRPPRPQT